MSAKSDLLPPGNQNGHRSRLKIESKELGKQVPELECAGIDTDLSSLLFSQDTKENHENRLLKIKLTQANIIPAPAGWLATHFLVIFSC